MKKSVKLLSPLFFVVACFSVLCISSFAEGEVSGVPLISINDEPGIPITSALTLEEGDNAVIISSGISSGITIPADAVVTVSPSVDWVVNTSIVVYGEFNIYGNISRTTQSGNGGSNAVPENAVIMIPADTEAVINQNYGSIVRDGGKRTIDMASGTYNLYSGNIVNDNPNSATYVVTMSNDAEFNFYSGSISGTYVFTDPTAVNFNSDPVITDDPRTYSVTPPALGSITSMVSSGISWVGQFANAITSNILLVVIVCFFIIGTGIGLIKRIIA